LLRDRAGTFEVSLMPRLVHVLGSLDVGGAELRLLDLCHELLDEPSEQIFLTLAGRRGAIAGRFEELGARVDQCPLRHVSTFPLRLFQTLRSLAPDIVVSHVSLVSGLVLTVARAARVPKRIAWIRSEGDGRASTVGRRLMRTVLRRLLRSNATTVVAVSRAALSFGLADPDRWRGAATVLPNGVDTARFVPQDRLRCRQRLGLAPDPLVLVHVGRAAPEKNRPFLIEVWGATRARVADATLVLAGPGGSTDVTEAHPQAAHNPAIVFTGLLDDVPTLLGAADVLVLPSTREGLPGAVLEALSSGVPVVANDLPGLRELADVLPGMRLVDVEAGADAWADAVLEAARLSQTQRRELHEAVVRSSYTLGSAARRWREMW
jgi:glycosyltransferase involved in cell wall biosynthesis